MQDSSFSRSGASNPRGKLVSVKLGLAEETLAAVERGSREFDMPVSEYLRIIVEGHVHGADDVARVAADRIRRVLRIGSELAQQDH